MARVHSLMVPLGTRAPQFSLPDAVTGKNYSLNDIKGSVATVIMFICNHCPFVKHVNHELVKLANDYKTRETGFAAISANDVVNYPEDAPDLMKHVALQLNYPFPYLYDETQETARAYEAKCTPDFFVFDKALQLVYRGQLDDSRPGNSIPVTGSDIRHALDCLATGIPVPVEQKPGIGCSIKWK